VTELGCFFNVDLSTTPTETKTNQSGLRSLLLTFYKIRTGEDDAQP